MTNQLEEYDINDLNCILANMIKSLPEKEAKVVLLRYFYGWTFTKISEYFNWSKSNAPIVHHKALRRLRHPSRMVLLYDYADMFRKGMI